MLQHESEEPVVPTAAQARVTPEELSAALKALEDQQTNTVAIGSVVDELRLNATPEQIWEQVQRQRAQAQQSETRQADAQQTAAVTKKAAGRRLVRGWRGIKGWVWIAFWCTGGLGLFSGIQQWEHPLMTNSGQTITISGDSQIETIPVQGKDVVIEGDSDQITLQGQARSVTVSGDSDMLRGDAPKVFDITGDGDHVQWTSGQTEPHPGTAFRPSP